MKIESQLQKFPDPQFWENFVDNYWEKKCFEQKNDLITFPMNPEEVFELIVENSDFNSPEFNDWLKVAINGKVMGHKKVQELNLAPLKKDGSFEGYHQRMEKEHPGCEYILDINLLNVPGKVRGWMYRFVQSLTSYTGKLNRGTMIAFFFGNYSRTHSGIHLDAGAEESDAGFFFPIRGEKKLRVWEPEFVRKNKTMIMSKKYEKWIDDSHLLNAKEEGMFFWPAKMWHIGESTKDDISIALAISETHDIGIDFHDYVNYSYGSKNVYRNHLLQKTFVDVKMLIRKTYLSLLFISGKNKNEDPDHIKRFPFDPNHLQKNAETIPDVIHEAGKYFKNWIQPEILERVKIFFWLATLSSFGANESVYRTFPQLNSDDSISMYPYHFAFWKRVSDDTVAVGLNGHTKEVYLSNRMESIFQETLDLLHSGEVRKVSSFLELGMENIENQEAIKEWMLELLSNFNNCRVLKVS